MVEATIQQWCDQCRRIVRATLRLGYKRNMLVADQSSCPHCGLVLWNWRWSKQPPKPVEQRPVGKQLNLF